jgi:hypothetical protein
MSSLQVIHESQLTWESEHIRSLVGVWLQQGRGLRHLLAQFLVLTFHRFLLADGDRQLPKRLRGLELADALVEPINVRLGAFTDGALGLGFPSGRDLR